MYSKLPTIGYQLSHIMSGVCLTSEVGGECVTDFAKGDNYMYASYWKSVNVVGVSFGLKDFHVI